MSFTKVSVIDQESGEVTWEKSFQIRSPFNYDVADASIATGLACTDETLAVQDQRDECDINTIVERFNVTGEVPTNVRQPLSMDFIEAIDFHTAQNALIEAQQSFMQMDAKTRARFNNDPGEFIAFFEDEANREEGERLGLINPRQKAPEQAPKGPEPVQATGAPSDT